MLVISEVIADELKHNKDGVETAIRLFDEGNTLHFIARYRKDVTHNLNDEQLFVLQKRLIQLRNLEERKAKSLEKLQEVGLLTDELTKLISVCMTLSELDNIMQPFRSKKKSRAMIAREEGYQELAKCLLGENKQQINNLLKKGIDKEEQLQKARDILAEELTYREDLTNIAIQNMQQSPIRMQIKDEQAEDLGRFDGTSIDKLKPHNIQQLFRAEKNKEISLNINVDYDNLQSRQLKKISIPKEYRSHIEDALQDGNKRLLVPRLTTQIKNTMKEKADERAIEVFKRNLEQLLLTAPVKPQPILAIDPGYRSGCKVAVVNDTGDFLDKTTIYPTPPKEEFVEAAKKIKNLVKKYKVQLIVVGNGTASIETQQFVKALELKCKMHVVGEEGASVYSASNTAREEFPHLAVETRGAISLARRVLDPLAEFVKIDPKSLGVGQYQHDVNQKDLSEALDFTVSKIVNSIGINLEIASKEALMYVSGISESIAKNIITYREDKGFNNLKDLLKVKRLGKATYEQCVGFLRHPNSKNPLDKTLIHPESYDLATDIVKNLGHSMQSWSKLDENSRKLIMKKVKNNSKVDDVNFDDIKSELITLGRDPRGNLEVIDRSQIISSIEDIEVGSIYDGQIKNVLDFGAFVDLGIKVNGLIHISNLSENYVQNIHEFVHKGQNVRVQVVDIDLDKKRIGLKLLANI